MFGMAKHRRAYASVPVCESRFLAGRYRTFSSGSDFLIRAIVKAPGSATKGHEIANMMLAYPLTTRPRMKRNNPSLPSQPFLRWTFLRGDQRLVCRVDRRHHDDTFTLSLARDRRQAGTEQTFASASSAFRRHAMMASELRKAGWRVASYTAD